MWVLVMNQQAKRHILALKHVYNEIFAKGNLQVYEDFVAENVQVHCPSSWYLLHASELRGRISVKEIDKAYSQAFAMHNVNIHDIFIKKDKIILQWSCMGFHRASFFALPASHRHFSMQGQSAYQFDQEGKIQEVWQFWDMFTLLQQVSQLSIQPLQRDSAHDLLLRKVKQLSAREKEVLRFMLDGHTAQDTAELLVISARTVEYYFENIKNKLDCSRKKDLFKFAQILEKQNLL